MEALGRVSKPFVSDASSLSWLYSFCRLSKRDSARVWEEFLRGRDGGLDAIQVFLTSYVRKALKMRIVLDAREYAKVRTVTNVSTVVIVWRALVAAADFHVMETKRRAQPKYARFWRLQWLHDVEGRLAGPGFKVVLVSNTSFLYWCGRVINTN